MTAVCAALFAFQCSDELPDEAWREITVAQGPCTYRFSTQRVRTTKGRKPGEEIWAVIAGTRTVARPAGEVTLVERDFDEAVLNLVSNAYFAMRLKQEELGDGYEPVLAVSSCLVDGMAEVKVQDNGPGIVDDVVGHIFNPFFSTWDGVFGRSTVGR